MGILGEPVHERNDSLLVGNRDVRPEKVVAPKLRHGLDQGERCPIPELIGGIDALVVEGSLLHGA